jgi:hypothetical protein
MLLKRNPYFRASMLLLLAASICQFSQSQRPPYVLRSSASIIRRKLRNRKLTTGRTLTPIAMRIFLGFVLSMQSAWAQTNSQVPLPYKYVGNSYSLKFHRPSCPFAKAMSVNHVQLFHFRREAIEAGEKPCNYCLPQSWGSVKAVVKPPLDPVESAQDR